MIMSVSESLTQLRCIRAVTKVTTVRICNYTQERFVDATPWRFQYGTVKRKTWMGARLLDGEMRRGEYEMFFTLVRSI